MFAPNTVANNVHPCRSLGVNYLVDSGTLADQLYVRCLVPNLLCFVGFSVRRWGPQAVISFLIVELGTFIYYKGVNDF